jgi:hypothetical protein
MRIVAVLVFSVAVLAAVAWNSPAYAQDCSHCYRQRYADMRQCNSRYKDEQRACRRDATDRAASCTRACTQSYKRAEPSPTPGRPVPIPF